MPRNIPPDELQGIIALTKEQVVRGLERKPTLSELLNEGALLLTEGSYLDRQIRLYPLGTAIALAHILSFINLE
jgi:hypothetical protein